MAPPPPVAAAAPKVDPVPPPPPPAPQPPITKAETDKQAPFDVVKVYFGTDRLDTASTRPAERFANDRGPGITYGECVVTIPARHRKGELEAPPSWLPSRLYRMMEDPERHVVLDRVTSLARDQFLDTLRRASETGGRKALVFVHGYNNTFEDAARRTAQITHDAEFDGVALFYSWPSKAALLEYPRDETNVDRAQIYLQAFMRDLALNGSFDSVYLIAHSMGNRALTSAFLELRKTIPRARFAVFKEIILAAPDIDAEVFQTRIAPALASTPSKITLYASSKDKALAISKDFNGYRRAGDTDGGPIIQPGIETIDSSGVRTELYYQAGLGHSYIGDSAEVLADLRDLLVRGLRPDQRSSLVRDAKGLYWKFKAGGQ